MTLQSDDVTVKTINRKEALLDYKNVSFSKSPKLKETFLVRLTHDFGKKKKPRCFSFFFLVKIRPEIMFNDVLNIKEASLENKDFFKVVNR